VLVRSGARLDPHEVIAPLGAGGMGEACRDRAAHGRPFDFAHGRPFDFAHGRPFDFAHGRPFDFAQGRSNSVQKVVNGSTVTLPDA